MADATADRDAALREFAALTAAAIDYGPLMLDRQLRAVLDRLGEDCDMSPAAIEVRMRELLGQPADEDGDQELDEPKQGDHDA